MFHRWRCSSPTSASADCHSSCQKSSAFTHLHLSRLSLPQKAAVTSLGVLRRARSQSDVRARIDAYLRRGRRGRELTSARRRVCDALPGGSRSCRVCSHLSGWERPWIMNDCQLSLEEQDSNSPQNTICWCTCTSFSTTYTSKRFIEQVYVFIKLHSSERACFHSLSAAFTEPLYHTQCLR